MSEEATQLDAENENAIVQEVRRLMNPPLEPATDEKLQHVWPAWNALPDEMIHDEKFGLLQSTILDEEDRPAREREALAALRARPGFQGFIPFDHAKYQHTLVEAQHWASLKNFWESTNRLFLDLIANHQWHFEDANAHAAGRIAIWRTVREIQITRPALLTTNAPDLESIRHLQARYAAYSNAREEALRQLAALIYKVEGIRAGKLVPIERRAHGVPHPPEDVPHHLYLARLDALGIASEEALREFFVEDLPKLNREERRAFYAMSLKVRTRGGDRYAALRVWLADNNPIFEQFGWRKEEIHEEAMRLKIPAPKHPEQLVKMRWGFRLAFNRKAIYASGPAIQRKINQSRPLLSPPPRFGEALKFQA